jgi:hypothetical protein
VCQYTDWLSTIWQPDRIKEDRGDGLRQQMALLDP